MHVNARITHTRAQGFTLIEILVAVVIMLSITGLLMLTYRESIHNGQVEAGRAHIRTVMQSANTWLASRPDLNAMNYSGGSCMTPLSFTTTGIVYGQNPNYPNFGPPPTGMTSCTYTAANTRAMNVTAVVNDETIVETYQ